MFQQIVLPLDLTDHHQQALDIAAELAGQSGGSVTLLHIIETIAGLSREEERDFYDRLEVAARSHLDGLGQRLDERRIAWRIEIRYGHRAAECVRFAADSKADLIVLTVPRLDPSNPIAGWGSLGYKIGMLSPCPVLTVK